MTTGLTRRWESRLVAAGSRGIPHTCIYNIISSSSSLFPKVVVLLPGELGISSLSGRPRIHCTLLGSRPWPTSCVLLCSVKILPRSTRRSVDHRKFSRGDKWAAAAVFSFTRLQPGNNPASSRLGTRAVEPLQWTLSKLQYRPHQKYLETRLWLCVW